MRTTFARYAPRIAVMLHDLVMIWVAWMAVHWLRYQILIQPPPLPLWPQEMPIVLLAQGTILYLTGLYRGIWRFASLPDLWNIIRAGIYGTLLILLALFLLYRLENVPRSVFLMYPVALICLLGAPRLAYRMWKDRRLSLGPGGERQRVLILGAGTGGELLARDLLREGPYQPIGFLDDSRRLWGGQLRGLPVLGAIERLGEVAAARAVDLAIIAIPSASNAQMQRIVSVCEEAGVKFATVPRLHDLISGRSTVHEIKDVAIEDLLGRDPAALDWPAIRAGISGKAVLVTGGGGSIGGELLRQIAQLGPAKVGIVERSELNLYQIELELRRDHPDLILEPVLGDVCDAPLIERTVERFRPDVIFHAAAYKHVPMLETHIREAVRNNVIGTEEVARAADRHGVGQFVLISTDKAVNPVSVMGATKRAAEICCQALAANSATRFITVRFGNVLDSAGSVVPLFREQIRRGGPVTVTHPEVRRYFMTIPEACQLIMQAAAIGRSGGIYVLDMGEPVKIQYLAEQMIRLAGKIPDKDVRIVHTGLRPGEKMFEELFHEQERYGRTEHEQILLAQHRYGADRELGQRLAALRHANEALDEGRLEVLLRELVPEYHRRDDDPKVVLLKHQHQR